MSRYLISEHEQGTDGWRLARAGRATGSKASCIVAVGRTKGVEATTRRDYRVQLVTERLTGSPAEDAFVTKEMQHGTEFEPVARMRFEAAKDELVEQAGFIYLPDIAAGCSLDGFVADRRGLFEAKCPKSSTHIAWLLAARIPPEHVPQITHNLWITGCEFVDFVSFDPRMPEGLQLFHVRAQRNEFDIAGHEAEVRKFLSEVDALEAQLRARSPVALAA